MRTLPLFLLALAACRSAPPPAETASVSFYGDVPRLETWEVHVADGLHVHSTSPGPGCPIEVLARETKLGSFCSILGRAHGGPGRWVLLLVPPDGSEALVVDVPRPRDAETTFTDMKVELERPAGTAGRSLERGRVTVRRVSPGRWDVELFAVLTPGPVQVVARAQAGAAP